MQDQKGVTYLRWPMEGEQRMPADWHGQLLHLQVCYLA